MRRQFQLGVLALAAVVAAASPLLRAEPNGDAKAAEVMARARKALGGEKKLAALKGLSMKAEFRRETSGPAPGGGGATFVIMGGGGASLGGGQVTGSIAIDVLFPDKFYREESATSGFAITRIDGFEGARPFLDVVGNSPGMRVMADKPAEDPVRAKAALRRGNTDLARLLLGMIAGTHAGLPVAYTWVGEAESADTVADVIEVTGPDEFKARLFVDQTTHLPLMLTFQEAERPVRMVTSSRGHDGAQAPAPPAGASVTTTKTPAPQGAPGTPAAISQLPPEQRAEIEKQIAAAAAEPPKIVEYRMFFADYREVGGVSLPHRITRANAEKTIEEWDVKEYKVNPTIKADRFKVGTE
jgi:hypothetical protein